MRIVKSNKTIKADVDWNSFGSSLGIVPKQCGPALWQPYDTYENSFVKNGNFNPKGYYSKEECQKAIDEYRSYLSRIWGRQFSEDVIGGSSMRITKSTKTDVKANRKLPVQQSSDTDKALQHIKAAIDILGTSGKKDAVTKDSIANLATVMFDIKASTDSCKYSKSECINAIQAEYGYNKKEAENYYKKADCKTLEALVEGFKANAKKSFYED